MFFVKIIENYKYSLTNIEMQEYTFFIYIYQIYVRIYPYTMESLACRRYFHIIANYLICQTAEIDI